MYVWGGGRAGSFLESGGENLFPIVWRGGRVYFLVVTGQVSPFSCWFSARGSSGSPEATILLPLLARTVCQVLASCLSDLLFCFPLSLLRTRLTSWVPPG